MRLIYAVLPVLLLAGCSSFRAEPENIKAVPEDRLLAYQEPVTGAGEIVVNRDLGLMGGGCYIAVLVDRQVAARIGMGEVASFQVPAGNRVLSIGIDKMDDTLCAYGRLRRELAVKVVAGERQQFRVVSQSQGGFDILPDSQ